VVESRRDRPAVRAFLTALAEPAVRERIAGLGMTLPDEVGHI
jgi:putative molybdopterin biosynthesis protein